MRCAAKDCLQDGTRYPVLLLFPKGMPGFHAPIRLVFGMLVCSEHQRQTSIEDLIGGAF